MKPCHLILLLGFSLITGCTCLSHRINHEVIRPHLAEPMQPMARFHIPGLRADQKVIALTIDDSPTPHTHQILDILKHHHATATFFVHGGQINRPEMRNVIRRMIAEGHEVGNHTLRSEPSLLLSREKFTETFTQNHRLLTQLNARPTRFRPSHGASNSMMREFMKTNPLACTYHPYFYLASIYSWDIHADVNRHYAQDAAKCAIPGRMIVFHDCTRMPQLDGSIANQSERTITSLPCFLESLKQQGFEAQSIAKVEALANQNIHSQPTARQP